jgi:menaquinone-dependent protoporphyrinogen oxidase
MTTKALVAYATKHGSTAEIATAIADTLRASGTDADLRAAREVADIADYDVVILGSGVYMNRWHSEALDFAKRFAIDLRQRSTWFFSSGPTGGTPKADAAVVAALAAQAPPPGQAGKWAERIGIRGHATFGGKVGDGLGGIFERWVPKGDWRDFRAISEWANGIAGLSRPDPDVTHPRSLPMTSAAPRVGH